MNLQALKGFKDILPDEVAAWQLIEKTARSIFNRFGFEEIKVPILEKTELFARSIGESTDIVEKEMYSFTDRNGESVTMRPEATASVLRAFIENGLHVRRPVQRLFTIGPMFRHENPQLGRLRQFHQMDVEVIGSDQAKLDAEVLAMAWLLVKELNLDASLEINSLGCRACRPDYKNKLVSFLESKSGNLCQDCIRRTKTNPLRVLDCKNEKCQTQFKDAPLILDNLCSGCAEHFQTVKQGLEQLQIPFTVNAFMVRGLDYYTRTTFELLTTALGSQSAVGAGGRYDGLIEQLGGPPLPGIGFGMGMERLALLLSQSEQGIPLPQMDVFVAALGEKAQQTGFELIHGLRQKGLSAAMDFEGRSLKSQMKQANKLNAGFALILGDDEIANKEAVLRNMENKEQLAFGLTDDINQNCIALKKLIQTKLI